MVSIVNLGLQCELVMFFCHHRSPIVQLDALSDRSTVYPVQGSTRPISPSTPPFPIYHKLVAGTWHYSVRYIRRTSSSNNCPRMGHVEILVDRTITRSSLQVPALPSNDLVCDIR